MSHSEKSNKRWMKNNSEPRMARRYCAEIKSKQQVLTEMTHVDETDQSLWIFRTMNARHCSLRRGLVEFRANLPVCLKKKVSQFWREEKKNSKRCQRGMWSDGGYGNGRWNSLKISSVKSVCVRLCKSIELGSISSGGRLIAIWPTSPALESARNQNVNSSKCSASTQLGARV